MVKNYAHNIIRLRKGKESISQVYWIIVILNKKKASSEKQVEQLGFYKQGKIKLFSINYQRLAFYLNRGYKLKNSIKKYIYWHSIVFNKYYKFNKIKKLQNLYNLFFKKHAHALKKKRKKKISILHFYNNYKTKANNLIIKWNKWKDKMELKKKEREAKKKEIELAKIREKAKEESKAWARMNSRNKKRDKNYIMKTFPLKTVDFDAEYKKFELEQKRKKKEEIEAPFKRLKEQKKFLAKAIKIKDVFKF